MPKKVATAPKKKEKIALGADPMGAVLKNAVKKHLESEGYKVIDYGTDCAENFVTYFGISAKTAKAVNCSSIKGLEQFHQVRHVDREPLRGGSTSMPITFTGLFEPIRSLFAATADAQARGFKKPHFSCLTKEGGCEACGGAGIMRIKMDFLADVVTPCEDCHGKRYKPEILEVAYEGINIAGILGMTVTEATVFFSKPISKFLKPVIYGLSVLDEIGLGYLQLGQPLDTLSGGEAQRLRLVDVLLKPSTGPTLFLFDEPTTGLHFKDTERLLTLFGRLIEQGHTIIVIEHNLDVISRAHHVIDLGPEGGDEGGAIITCGTAEEIAACKNSHTGRALLQRFKKSSQKTSWP